MVGIKNYLKVVLTNGDSLHFYRKNGKILVFIEDAIFEFRDELHKGIAYEETKV